MNGSSSDDVSSEHEWRASQRSLKGGMSKPLNPRICPHPMRPPRWAIGALFPMSGSDLVKLWDPSCAPLSNQRPRPLMARASTRKGRSSSRMALIRRREGPPRVPQMRTYSCDCVRWPALCQATTHKGQSKCPMTGGATERPLPSGWAARGGLEYCEACSKW